MRHRRTRVLNKKKGREKERLKYYIRREKIITDTDGTESFCSMKTREIRTTFLITTQDSLRNYSELSIYSYCKNTIIQRCRRYCADVLVEQLTIMILTLYHRFWAILYNLQCTPLSILSLWTIVNCLSPLTGND